MTTVLYIQASPRGGQSYSIQAADAFINAYTEHHPDDQVDKLNLFEADLPAFKAEAAAAKFKIPGNQQVTPEERSVWTDVEALIEQFKAADKIVLAAAMWNFSIPYRLKQYIDILVQPGYTFTVGESGYEGLVTGKPLMAVYARGGAYPEGSPGAAYDMQIPYTELVFGFMGFTDIRKLVVEPTKQEGKEGAEKALAAAVAKVDDLAKKF